MSLFHTHKKFTVIVIIGLAVLGAWFCKVVLDVQAEKNNALLMQTILINMAIVEEAYYDRHGSFATQWQDILPQVARPSSMPVFLAPKQNKPEVCWVAFGDRPAQTKDGYEVSFSVTDDGKTLNLLAKRVGGGWYHYTLQYTLPQQQTACQAGFGTRLFCRNILKKIENLDIRNLVPVSVSSSEKKVAL